MTITGIANEEQVKLWNASQCAWVDAQQLLDRMFQSFETLIVEEVRAASARSVLDVGCGTGATTLAIARQLGAKGRSVGIDISEPMLALARVRAEREGSSARFVRADAQTHAFEPAAFDLIVSRFGVMFFDDPVRAFANLRRTATDSGQLRCIVWRSAVENPFMTTAERAAAPYLPNIPPREPNAPGQFAFADRERVEKILEQGGWADIDIQPLDVPCTLRREELDGYVTRLGPVGRALQDADEKTRIEVVGVVRAAFAPYLHAEEARFNAACWMVAARASGTRLE